MNSDFLCPAVAGEVRKIPNRAGRFRHITLFRSDPYGKEFQIVCNRLQTEHVPFFLEAMSLIDKGDKLGTLDTARPETNNGHQGQNSRVT